MAGDRLPIVFKSNIWGAALTAIACALCVWAGIAIVNGDYYSRGAHFGPIHLSSDQTGWFLLAVGIPLGLFAAMAAVRGCPNLTLTERGLTLSRCIGGTVTIAWSELAGVTVRSMPVRRGTVRVVYLLTKDGRDISIGPVRGKAEEIAETIRRVAGSRAASG